jgi:hypothetical protein
VTISLKPNDADAYFYRGIEREKMGNTDSAKADYKNAVIFGRADAENRRKTLGAIWELKERNRAGGWR